MVCRIKDPPCNPPADFRPLPVRPNGLQALSSGLWLSPDTKLTLSTRRISRFALAATPHDAQRITNQERGCCQLEIRERDHANDHTGELDTEGTRARGRDGPVVA